MDHGSGRSVLATLFSELCAFLWPLVGGAGVLGLLVLVVFAVVGGHYGQLALLFYGPVALGLLLLAALLRPGARR